MEEWKTYRLEEIGKIVTGKTPSTKNPYNYGGDIHFITPGDLCNGNKHIVYTNRNITTSGLSSIKGSILPKGAICVSCIGNLGYTGIATMQCASNQQINSIIVNPNHNPDFIYYVIKHMWPYFKSLEGQSTALSILNKSQFSKIEIPLPNKKTQNIIASILSSFDEKIEINNRINHNLEQQMQTLYREWFIDNPKTEWATIALSEVATFVSGYSYKGNELVDSSETAMATIKNFERNGGFKLDGYKPVSPSSKLKEEQHAELFDVLVAHTDLTQNAEVIGNAEIILSKDSYSDVIFSMDLVKVVAKESFPYQFLLALLLKNPVFKSHCIGYVNGTTVLHMNKRALPDFNTQIPNCEDAARMNEIAKSIFTKMSENLSEIANLTKLRDSLLPKLMSGELKINEIDC